MLYLDNAATTKPEKKYLDIYLKYQEEDFFNPSAPYAKALDVSRQLNNARNSILKSIGGDGKVIFTSSGTESDNLALFGTKKSKKSRIIISAAEHPAVYTAAMELKQRGFDVVEVKVDEVGRVDFEEFKRVLTKDTSLVSVMHVNNESGGINNIEKLAQYVHSFYPDTLFHSDGVQAIGKTYVNMTNLGVDLYSFSGHKLGCPKGIGGLYVKKGINLQPIIFGGGQEGGVRSSTENVGGAIALAAAVEDAINRSAETECTLRPINEYLQKMLLAVDKDIKIIHNALCTSSILTFASEKVKGEVLLRALEDNGIIVGTGSACASRKSVKRVPTAMGVQRSYQDGIIRLSFSPSTDAKDMDYFVKCFNLEYSKLENIR